MKFNRIYIWGPNPFNNRLIAQHIESVSGTVPECFSARQEFAGRTLDGESIFFCDCDKTDIDLYCKILCQPRCDLESAPKIVLLNVDVGIDLLDDLQMYSICGIFYSTDDFALFGRGVQKVLEGEYWLSRRLLAESLMSIRANVRREKMDSYESTLTLREREIMQLIVSGFDNQAIADKLYISPNTVKTHISNVYKKIAVTNRVQAMLWASENSGQFFPFDSLDGKEEFQPPATPLTFDGIRKVLGKST